MGDHYGEWSRNPGLACLACRREGEGGWAVSLQEGLELGYIYCMAARGRHQINE